MTAEGYEYFDVAPDVGVAAWAKDWPGCLRQCALGLFNLIVPTDAVAPLESREVTARGASVEVLLVNWLNECLYVHDLEGFGVADVTRPEVSGSGVHAMLRGEPIDPVRHPRGTIVKAAASHGVEVRLDRLRASARVVLDI